MADPLTHLRQRADENWLISITDCSLPNLSLQSQEFRRLAEQRTQELCVATNLGTPPFIVLTEKEPIKFLSSFIAACIEGCSILLGNPHWMESEWRQVWNVVQPDLIWGHCSSPPSQSHQRSPHRSTPGQIMISTGGSSGNLRFAIHTWDTLMASVMGFQQYFQVDQVNACCVLPLYHVSGLMQFLRSFTSGGKLAILPFKALETESKLALAKFSSAIDPATCFLSLVPTQLQRLLQKPQLTAWLKSFQAVLLGGAPAWAELLSQARQQQIRLALTYGMTETAAQVATLKPEDFLRGNDSCGQVLPHAKVTIAHAVNGIGNITIQAQSLALGYYPDCPIDCCFQADDLGFFDAQGYLHILGRSSQKIITGGENVFPIEVEAAIRASGLVRDVCVIGLPDRDWGEVVAAVYIPLNSEIVVNQLQQAIASHLSKYKHPKHWLVAADLPRNTQGKINLKQVKQMFSEPQMKSPKLSTD
jgi:o-succinylbenzoate---CoA ligase